MGLASRESKPKNKSGKRRSRTERWKRTPESSHPATQQAKEQALKKGAEVGERDSPVEKGDGTI